MFKTIFCHSAFIKSFNFSVIVEIGKGKYFCFLPQILFQEYKFPTNSADFSDKFYKLLWKLFSHEYRHTEHFIITTPSKFDRFIQTGGNNEFSQGNGYCNFFTYQRSFYPSLGENNVGPKYRKLMRYYVIQWTVLKYLT